MLTLSLPKRTTESYILHCCYSLIEFFRPFVTLKIGEGHYALNNVLFHKSSICPSSSVKFTNVIAVLSLLPQEQRNRRASICYRKTLIATALSSWSHNPQSHASIISREKLSWHSSFKRSANGKNYRRLSSLNKWEHIGYTSE
jgi:hypothetical protein